MYPRIKNWIADEQPSAIELEGLDCFSNPNIEICDLEPLEIEMAMSYMNGVQYKKPVQPKFSPDSHRYKSRIKRSVDRAGTSGKSSPSVLLLTDSSVRQARVPNNDDDNFVDPPPIWQETSPIGKSPTQDCLSAAHHSPMEQQAREAQWGDVSCYFSQLSNNYIVVKTVEPNVDRKGKGKLDPTDDIVLSYTLEAPSFDLRVGSTQPDILHSEDIQKHVDSIISDVVTTITTVDTKDTTTDEPNFELPAKRVSRPAKILWSLFVAGEGKLFKHDDIVVFENYKGRVDKIDSSAFMA
ncbi:Hypothetical predicted protein [Olea europaea subsp. europaea]|uniref:Uncharacterized protein n=1 Tax=Olea europaea subsp. europaea TaxID=158383 RepID=A0A8S0S3E9_OLEEU|nr:Hypothetical predicted protein [Olea europaea subsp. europaea]